MTILVTGGAGYIGSQTCKELRQHGFEPVVLDNMTYGHEWATQWGPLIKGNICNNNLVMEIVEKYNIQAVIHFAGYTYVGESTSDPQKYYENNVLNSFQLINSLKQSGVRKIVFSSTAAVYGAPLSVPIYETATLNPINPYGETKRIVENILKSYCCYGFQSIVLRYFNACGASLDFEIGEDHSPETHLIPLAIRAAFDPNYSLQIFGTDYKTPDGTCIRDYIHVEDIAKAHVLALKKLFSPSTPNDFFFDAYNLGSSKGYSVYEIINAVESTLNIKVKTNIAARRQGDPEILVASNERAFKELSWIPKNSDLQTIISSAARWHKKHHFGR